MEIGKSLESALIWIEGQTGVQFILGPETVNGEVVSWFSEPVPVGRGPMSMVVTTVQVVLSGTTTEDNTALKTDSGEMCTLSCQFMFTQIDGGVRGVTRDFLFKKGFLYHVVCQNL